jgi:hypothetical protein
LATDQYRGFLANSRAAEAKIYLSLAYTAERNFQMDRNSYTSCLAVTGFRTERLQSYYTIGFAADAGNCITTTNNAAKNGDDHHDDDDHSDSSNRALATSSASTGQPCPTLPADLPTCSDNDQSTYFSGTKTSVAGASLPTQQDLTGTAFSVDTFTIAAVGQVNSNTPRAFDKWTIDSQKRFLHGTP